MTHLLIVFLAICTFMSGMSVGVIVGRQPVTVAIKECEKSLPRNQTCKAVIQAAPNEVKP